LTFNGYKAYLEDRKIEAEASFRKAESKDPGLHSPAYNLGTTQYRQDSYGEAFGYFKKAAAAATSRDQRHLAYHNMGNVLMQRKDYQGAVQAYKEALKNNPEDEETRYNYALAKEMLEKNPPKDNNQDPNKDQQKQDKDNDGQGNQDNKDDQQGDQGQEGNQGDKKDDSQSGDQDQKDGESEQDKEEDQGKDGSKDKDQSDKDSDKSGDQKDPQRQSDNKQDARPQMDRLSQQSIQNLLEALENEEKRVQEKVQAQKVKGKPIKTDKDW